VLEAGRGVECWGRNDAGQLGDGTRTERHVPVRVRGLEQADPISVAVSRSASCALLADGHVRCWGSGAYGAVGDGTFSDRPIAVEVSDLTDAVELAGGWDHFCARRASGRVSCWGKILGDGAVRAVPAVVAGLPD